MRAYRFVLRPGWLGGHVAVLAVIVTMVLLGRWQMTVSEEKHFDVINFGYALQWWIFCVFAALMWGRIMRDHQRRTAGATVGADPGVAAATPTPAATSTAPQQAYRRYVPPSMAQIAADEPGYAEYNDYLARLNGLADSSEAR